MQQARERLSLPSRRPPTPYPSPAHKSFADRSSLYQEITDKIVAELAPGRVPWTGVGGPLALPKYAATGRAYSGINFLIQRQPQLIAMDILGGSLVGRPAQKTANLLTWRIYWC